MFRLALLLLVLLTGCQALQGTDTVATLQVENIAYNTEAAQLQAAGTAEQANVQQTYSISQTQIAALNAVNQQLVATLVTWVTPTPNLIVDSSPDDYGLTVNGSRSGGTTSAGGNTPYAVTGVSTSVNSSDGCVQNPQTSFSVSVPQVYVTFVAYNLAAGTQLRAEWYREGDIVDTGEWTPNQNSDQICVWFYIRQSDVAFTPGNWSVRLYANNQQIGGTQSFTFESDDMSDG